MIYIALLVINILLIQILHNLAFKIKLVDHPSTRKLHKGSIPLVGGIAIYFTMIIGSIIIDINSNLLFILYCASIVVLIGLLDDLINLDFKIRFFCQFVAALIIITKGIYINSISLLDIYNQSYLIYIFIPFTILSIVGFTNAFNFIDGIDGLASFLFAKSILLLLIIIYNNDKTYDLSFFYLILISILPFIIFNLGFIKNNKIFLGDSGSTLMGFILGWILIFFSQVENNLINPILVIWIAPIIVFDFFMVIFLRIYNKINPFAPDNIHLHYILLKKFSKSIVLLLITSSSIIFSVFGMLSFYYFGELISLILFLFVLVAYIIINLRIRKYLN